MQEKIKQKRGHKKGVLRGQMRVEFVRNKEEIFSLIAEGHTYITIFKKLTEEGKISHTYPLFCKYIKSKGTTTVN